MLKYKGYTAYIRYCYESRTLWGKISNIDVLVTFESVDETIDSLIEEFHNAVNDFISDLINTLYRR